MDIATRKYQRLLFEHRKLFYDKLAKQWRKERVVQAGLGEEFDFTQAEREDQIDTVAQNYMYCNAIIII